jgi:sirohydrochlorin ferrochelatase
MKSKSAVVLIAHGSRVAEANEEVQRLAERLKAKLRREVIACFLELIHPNIPEGIDMALLKSPPEILVLPYFLTQGRHVQEDIPKILSEKAKAYPETHIKLLDYLGANPRLLDLLEELILT